MRPLYFAQSVLLYTAAGPLIRTFRVPCPFLFSFPLLQWVEYMHHVGADEVHWVDFFPSDPVSITEVLDA